MKARLKFSVLVLAMVLSQQVQAQDTVTDSGSNLESSEQDLVLEQVWDEINHREQRWYGLMRVRTHSEQVVSAGFGAMLSKQPKHVDCSFGCSLSGWHFAVDAGLRGVQAGVGWGKLFGETGRTKRLITSAHFGWNLRAVALRTWGDNGLYPNEQTLVGLEGGFSIIRINISAGVLRSLYSGPGQEYTQNWVFTAGVGWGF